MTENKDLEFLKFKDEDTPEIRGIKSYWQMVMAMPIDERKVFLQEELIREHERELRLLLGTIDSDDKFITYCTNKAKSLVRDWELYGKGNPAGDEWLALAELYMSVAQGAKEHKVTIKDIRKHREIIQWEKSKLAKMQKLLSVEQNQSSNHSTN